MEDTNRDGGNGGGQASRRRRRGGKGRRRGARSTAEGAGEKKPKSAESEFSNNQLAREEARKSRDSVEPTKAQPQNSNNITAGK